MTSEDFNGLGAELMASDAFTALGTDLMAADEAADPRRLADLAWQLYSEAGIARAETIRLHGLLRSVCSQLWSRPVPGEAEFSEPTDQQV